VTIRGSLLKEEIRVHTARPGTTRRFAMLVGDASDEQQQEATSGNPDKQQWRSWSEYAKDVNVTLSDRVTVLPTFRSHRGAVATKDRRLFEFFIGPAADPSERMSVTIAQLSRPALDVQARHLGKLGATRIGGLLGTEAHDPELEEPSLNCSEDLKSKGMLTEHDWQRIIAEAQDGNSASATMLAHFPVQYEQAADLLATW